MEGLFIRSNDRFCELFAPLMDEFKKLYWVLSFNTGPFNYVGRPDWEQIDEEFAKYELDVPAWENIGQSLWKPGTFPKFSELLFSDEFNYLVGFEAIPENAVKLAVEICEHDYLTEPFFKTLKKQPAIFIAEIDDNWWEVYSSNQALMQKIVDLGQPIERVHSKKWIEDMGR